MLERRVRGAHFLIPISPAELGWGQYPQSLPTKEMDEQHLFGVIIILWSDSNSKYASGVLLFGLTRIAKVYVSGQSSF